MNLETAVSIVQGVIVTSIMLIVPFLGTAMVIGIAVSIFQTVTSIQDQTLTFVPKLVILGAIIFLASHWALRELMEFTYMCFQKIPGMVR
ncbi:MAG: hypothetical protein A2Y14_02015 [Verrucomicrobia bacterium GWF2_51_19]|nr:MAG: hypothetical protein A2Y14_02015 [Verrucomicrobia bacterium GWF2_51_19]HCJ12056.1 flagellar biosynthetic protein FliQ [Opitutae bacterium]